MICIFSSSTDYSTTEVIKWLNNLGENDILRVNYEDYNIELFIEFNTIKEDLCFKINDNIVKLRDISAVWYRKGKNWLCNSFCFVKLVSHPEFTTYLNNKLQSEKVKLTEFLHLIIENSVPTLGSPTKCDINKLFVLNAAKEIGFLVPNCYISNRKEVIKQIFSQNPNLITKPISDGLYLFEKTESNTGYFSYTEKVDKNLVEHLPDLTSPSLLQENINKKFDLRVFFLEDKCYSMAIISQLDEQTKIDFRKYNEKRPNRNIPFVLPPEVENKLKQLFKRLSLNTGSADFIVDQQDNFYFLEINPVGQFSMVSKACNYFLEKQVALNLIHYARQNGKS